MSKPRIKLGDLVRVRRPGFDDIDAQRNPGAYGLGNVTALFVLDAENGQDWRGRMNELMRLRVTWAPLIPHWPAIEEAYRAQAAEEARQYADHVRVHRGQRLRFRPATGPSRCYYLVQWLRFRHDPYAGQDVPWQRLEVGDV